MLLYQCVKTLMYVVAAFAGLLFIVGQKKPQCMAVAFVLLPVCMLLYGLKRLLWLRANQHKPLVCVEATLVNHRLVYEGSRMSSYKTSFLTFETADGKRLEFEVPREEFARIQIGAKGPLEYRGNLYVSFRRKK